MRISYIELKPGEKHPMCFSLSAVEALCDEFGDLENMRKAVTDSGTLAEQIKATNTVMSVLIDAGRKYCAEMGIELPPAIKCRPADLIDITDPSAVQAIFSTISSDSEREVEARSKKEQPTEA